MAASSALLALFDSAVLVEDAVGRIVFANQAFRELFEIDEPADSLTGREASSVTASMARLMADPDAFVGRIEEISAAATAVSGLEVALRDGRELELDFRVSVDPRLRFWQYRRVTTAARARVALRASEARKAAILGTAMDAIVTMDASGIISEFNSAAERMFGWSREEALGQDMGSLIVPEAMREAHRAGLERYLVSGEPRILGRRIELPALRRDGTEFLVEISINVIPGEDPPVFTGFIRDVTRERERESDLVAARDEAQKASRAKSEFLAVMSHEIRTPMNAIMGMTDLALETELTPDQRELLGTVRRNTERLLGLVTEILDFSRIDAGPEIRARDFSVRELVESVTEAFAPRAFECGLGIACAVQPDVVDRVNGDADRVRQILVNLLGNAIKFTEAGHVGVTVSRVRPSDAHDPQVELIVSDTGIGIPEDLRERVFEPFSQVDSSTRRAHGGSGLGLASARGLAEAMGGTLTVQSSPGRGSRFTLRLPAPPAVEPADAVDAPASGVRVLVVGFGPEERWSVVSALTFLGAGVEAVEPHRLPASFVGEGGSHLVVADGDLGRAPLIAIAEAVHRRRASEQLVVVVTPGREHFDPHLPKARYLARPITTRKLRSSLFETDVVARAAGEQGAPRGAALAGSRILVVDDNEDNRRYAIRVLEAAGFEVTVAVDGADGLKLARSRAFDLVLSDLEMPAMDGFDMSRAIRAWEASAGGRRTPIVALTAHAVEGFRERCFEAGMDAYLTKPIRPSELRAAVEEARRRSNGDDVMTCRVLVAAGSWDDRSLARRALGPMGVRLVEAETTQKAVEVLGAADADLAVLAVPGDGEVADAVRDALSQSPVPLLAIGDGDARVADELCRELGCDAYVRRPVDEGVLRRWVAAALARAPSGQREAAVEAPGPEVARTPGEGPVALSVLVPRPDEAPVIDPDIADLVPAYLQGVDQLVATMRTSLAEGDFAAVASGGHDLAGSGTGYGYPFLTRSGRAVEAAALQGLRDQLDAWLGAMESYLAALDRPAP